MADKTINIEGATATITLSIDGKVYLVAITNEKLEALTFLIKQATDELVPTGIMQGDLRDFLTKGLN